MTRQAIVLRGRDHGVLGGHAVTSIDSSLALCTSAGATPKPTTASHANEDAGAIAADAGRALLVLADAHFGWEAADLAVEHVLDALGPSVPKATDLRDTDLVGLFFDAGVKVQRETASPGFAHPDSRTTLALALVCDDAIRWGALGDSCVLLVSSDGCDRVDRPRRAFLGQQFDVTEIAATISVGICARVDAQAVVLATDGLVDGLGAESIEGDIADLTELQSHGDAASYAQRLVMRALERQVADAVTVAVALAV